MWNSKYINIEYWDNGDGHLLCHHNNKSRVLFVVSNLRKSSIIGTEAAIIILPTLGCGYYINYYIIELGASLRLVENIEYIVT